MSLKTEFPKAIPDETRRVVEPLLCEDNIYRLVGQEIEQMLDEAVLAEMYDAEGRPAINPIVLTLVTVFQFLEKLPDRMAAEMAVMRLDWKYALRQALDWAGFHYTDLCNFRKRLLRYGQEQVAFERVVKYLRERGYIRAGGKQRTDSTHIVGAVMRLSRLELVWETLRLALGALVNADAPWTLKWLPRSFVEPYSARRSDYRLSQEEVVQALRQTGQDGYWLLDQVAVQGSPGLQALPEIVRLRRVWEEQFTRQEDGSAHLRPPGEAGGDVITSPHDADVRYGDKGSRNWVGYKLQVTETADPEAAARFITDVALTSTVDQDNEQVEALQHRLLVRQLAPAQQYVDQGYMSGENLARSLEHGIDLRGFMRDGNVSKRPEFRLSQFMIDLDQRQALCPAGQRSVKWAKAKPDVKNLIAYHVSFGRQCRTCPFFGPDLCTDKASGRHLSVSRYHALLQARRREADTLAFQREMHTRAGIEGTISELVRAHGARRSRYRGLAKNQLQALFTATATNLKRLARTFTSATSFISLRFFSPRSLLTGVAY
jgi:transposase